MLKFRFTPSRGIVVGTVLCAASLAALSSVANGLSTKNGVFTEEQAARGKQVYEKSCQNCHQPDFYVEKLAKWENKPVGALFQALSTTMPADNVGSLLTSEYLDVLAYVFSITGSPAGKSELTTDNMDSIAVAPLK
jgi:S-disulfanyl-L-cysteine oxidoreductase SoxD